MTHLFCFICKWRFNFRLQWDIGLFLTSENRCAFNIINLLGILSLSEGGRCFPVDNNGLLHHQVDLLIARKQLSVDPAALRVMLNPKRNRKMKGEKKKVDLDLIFAPGRGSVPYISWLNLWLHFLWFHSDDLGSCICLIFTYLAFHVVVRTGSVSLCFPFGYVWFCLIFGALSSC